MPRIKVNNLNIYYELHGQGSPLVLISGLGMSHAVWLPLIPTLSKDHQILIFDNRGIASSDSPDNSYTIEDMAEDVFQLISALNLEKPHVLGTSMGGSIALALALKYGNTLDKLILDSTTSKLNFASALAAKFSLNLYKTKMPLEQKAQNFISWTLGPDYLSTNENYQKSLSVFLSNKNFPNETGFKRQLEALLQFDLKEELLEKIKCSTLVLKGEKDIVVHADESQKIVNSLELSSYYCFKKTGHMPYVEHPDLFSKIVLDFIDSKIPVT
jgi:3-oxoadipate enol-lactonase